MNLVIWHVYILRCGLTGKQYVGITSKPVLARWASHVVAAFGKPSPKFHSQRSIIAAAIRESGPENFTVEHVLSCCSRNDAEYCEAELVARLDCQHPKGLNATPSGGTRGLVQTPEARAKNSATKRAIWAAMSAEERAAAGAAAGGHVKRWWAGMADGVREAKIAKLKAWARSPENRQRIAIIGKTRVVKDQAFEDARRAGVRAATRAGRMGAKAKATIRDRRQQSMF